MTTTLPNKLKEIQEPAQNILRSIGIAMDIDNLIVHHYDAEAGGPFRRKKWCAFLVFLYDLANGNIVPF